MYEGKTVAVVVPAHNEEALVGSTVSGIPGFVDKIFVVDDGSTDATSERAQSSDKRVELISHERNEGVGAAIISGYRRAMQEKVDVTCVMAADGQMDPDDLETLVRAIALDECDYAKANRLFTGQAWEIIPRTRYLGNAVLSGRRAKRDPAATRGAAYLVAPRQGGSSGVCGRSTSSATFTRLSSSIRWGSSCSRPGSSSD